MVVQGSEGVGRWNQRSVLKCSTLCSHPARGGTATHQKLEVSLKQLSCSLIVTDSHYIFYHLVL